MGSQAPIQKSFNKHFAYYNLFAIYSSPAWCASPFFHGLFWQQFHFNSVHVAQHQYFCNTLASHFPQDHAEECVIDAVLTRSLHFKKTPLTEL